MTVETIRWFVTYVLGRTVKIPILSFIWRKLTGSEISIANIFSLFIAIPAVVLTKIFTLGHNLVPDDHVHNLTSWTAREYTSLIIEEKIHDEHDKQLNESRATVEYGGLSEI
jgi:hypothetical protein